MELLQLRYFRTVARMEHMTRAAQELRIAQPALSKTIARLEEDVGVPLFDRQRGRIRLNTFGKVYLDKVEKALNLLDEGQKEVSELAGLEHGSIHLATSTLDRLSEPLGDFLTLHPEVNFRITQASTEEMANLIESGEVDVCFTALPFKRTGICATTVLNEGVYLAVPQGHRLAERKSVNLSEVADEPFIGYKEGFLFQEMNDMFFQEAGITPNYVCRVDEPAAIASLVRAGLGVALFGCKSGEDPKLTLMPIVNPVCERNFQIIWHEKRYLSLAARKFRNFVVQYFADIV
jgi:LysR family transcriptional regulator, transcription activator of glutamate synthase operon